MATTTFTNNELEIAAVAGWRWAELLARVKANGASLAIIAAGAGPPSTATPAGGTAPAGIIRYTTATSFAAGAVFARFENVGVANATIDGIILKPGEAVPFPTDYGMLLPAFAIIATGTEVLCNYVRSSLA